MTPADKIRKALREAHEAVAEYVDQDALTNICVNIDLLVRETLEVAGQVADEHPGGEARIWALRDEVLGRDSK